MNWLQGVMNWSRWTTLVVVVIAAGCSTSSSATNGKAEQAPPIESESPEIQAEFDEAFEMLGDGQWEEAHEEFRLLQGQYAGDDTAALAELYIARALLGDLEMGFEGDDEESSEFVEGVDPEVYALLEPLADSQTVDDRIRYGARVYLAVAYALDDNVSAALDIFKDYPGASIGPAVLQEDQRWVWPLLAEGLTEAGRHGQAVMAWGRLHSLLRQEAAKRASIVEEEAGDEASPSTQDWFGELDLPSQANLAVTRAFEAAEYLGEDELHGFLNQDQELVRAVGVWALVRKGLSDEPSPERIEGLQSIFNEWSQDFLVIGAADRASELSSALAAVSGPQRLIIGALVPLTGPNRAVGYRALAGMLVAQRAFHAAGQPSVTLIIEDSHPGVVAGYERLVDEDALAVVGPLQTVEARELTDAASEHGVPVLALAADRIIPLGDQESIESAVEGGEEHEGEQEVENGEVRASTPAPVFRNFIDSVAEARAAAFLAADRLGDRRAAVVYPDMGYGRVLSQAFVTEFRRQGGEVVADIEYDRSASDYVSLARQVSRSNPEAIFLPDTGAKVAEITAFFAQENIWGVDPTKPRPSADRVYVHYLGTSLWQDPIVLHQAASYVDGALIPAWYSAEFSDADSRQLSQGFEAIYGRRADSFVAFSYDSVNRLRSLVLERGLTDAQGITDALRQRNWVSGATGRSYFGDHGEPHRELRYLKVDGDQWAISDETVMTPLEGRSEVESELADEELDGLEDEASEATDSDHYDGS